MENSTSLNLKDNELNEDSFPVTEEELLQKHKVQRKELQCTIQKMKKSGGGKKVKKDVADEIGKLERGLRERQEEELLQCRARVAEGRPPQQEDVQVTAQLTELTVTDSIEQPAPPQPAKVSRAAKRRAAKADAAQLREAELEKEREYQFLHSPRAVEQRVMARLLRERKLLVTEVPPDGDCMYAALSHQLAGAKSAANLRHIASQHLQQHRDDFLPFLTDPDTGDLITQDTFTEYCDTVANTHVWGGQPELRALSEALERKIEVLQAEGSSIVLGYDFPGPALLLAYYRHCFSLGEHYNSLTPQGTADAVTS